MSTDEMIACLGGCRARWEIAAMIKALSLHPRLNTPAETKSPRGLPRRDGELEVLQPRLPSPAQRAPLAPQPPLNNEAAARPRNARQWVKTQSA